MEFKGKISKKKILLAFVFSLSLLATGFLAGNLYRPLLNPRINFNVLNSKSSTATVDFARFWEVWELLEEKYLFGDLDPQKLLYGAIEGMVEASGDPYTSFLEPEDNAALKESLNGSYEGIGAELGMEEDQLIIVAPLDGSPAKAAGIKPQDKILKIDDEITAGISIIEAVSKIRGEKDTKVKLTLQRGTEEPFEIELTRAKINVPSVALEWCSEVGECVEKGSGNIAYVRLSRFGDDTNSVWDSVVSQITSRPEVDSLILDVRGNPGGYLLSSIHISQDFLQRGDKILWQEDANGFKKAVSADTTGKLNKFDSIVILIDEGSASASEIVAAALDENLENVTLVGKKSFGKGTVQDAQDFIDGSGIHITVAKWLTPKQNWVHEKGINPEVEINLDEEKYKEEIDTQLLRAIETLNK